MILIKLLLGTICSSFFHTIYKFGDKKQKLRQKNTRRLHNLCEKTQKISDNNDDEVEENTPGEKIRTSHNA